MSSAGKEIIGWWWLEAGGMMGEHPPMPLWGWCPWKPVAATLRWGHLTITNAPLMPVNDCWATVWHLGKKQNRKKNLTAFFFLWLFYWIFTRYLCVSPQVESVCAPQLQQHLASKEDRQIQQSCLPNKALLKLYATVSVLPRAQHCVEIRLHIDMPFHWMGIEKDRNMYLFISGYVCLTLCCRLVSSIV